MKNLFTLIACAWSLNILQAQWEPLGGAVIGTAYITNVAVTQDFVWAGTVWNGVWKQNKQSGQWQNITTLPDSIITIDIKTLGEVVFVLDQDRQLFVSSDTGLTWNNITPSGQLNNFSEILVDSNKVWLGGNIDFEYGSLQVTQDTGKSWNSLNFLIDDELFYPAMIARTKDAIFSSENYRMFRTMHKGNAWEELNVFFLESGCQHCEITQLFSDGNALYALEMNDYYHSSRLHVSKDNGENWEVVDLGFPGSGFNAGFMYYTTVNDILLASDLFFEKNGLRASFDEGLTSVPFDEGLITAKVGEPTHDEEYLYTGTGGEGVWRRKLQELYLTSVQQPISKNEISIFPNPSTGNFTIRPISKYPGKATLLICDISGKTCLTKNLLLSGETEIHTEALSPGIYFLTLHSANMVYSAKIIIQK